MMEDMEPNKHAEPLQQKFQPSSPRQGPATCSTMSTYITCPSRPEFLPLQVAVYVGIKIQASATITPPVASTWRGI